MQAVGLLFAGCVAGEESVGTALTQVKENGTNFAPPVMPDLLAAELNGDKLHVVATTSIVGDIVSRVGGDAIELTVLLNSGQDPHSFEPSASDLRSISDAQVVFVNGWNLEEGMLDDLQHVSDGVPQVPVSANITPIALGGDGEAETGLPDQNSNGGRDQEGEHADPHTWLDPHLVRQWVENIETALVTLEPANASEFRSNADAYLNELDELVAYYDEQVALIPPSHRKLVTNHDALGYFAKAYGFEIIGTVIPSFSTLAEPSASELAELSQRMKEEGVCTIFADITASDVLANAVANEVDGCSEVRVVKLFTGALGPQGSGTDSYIGMAQANIDAISAGLR